MVKTRDRQQAAQEWASRAEQPEKPATPARRKPPEPAWKTRNREPKFHGVNIRVSKSQLELLKSVADWEEISQQKLVESILWPVLEEKYEELFGTVEEGEVK
jgi:hypothetical protein